MMTTRRISSHQEMESCHMVDEHTRSCDENEPKMPVNSFTWFRSVEFSFRHCHRRNFWERQFTCLSLRPMKTLTKHKPIDGMKPPQLSFGCIASLAAFRCWPQPSARTGWRQGRL